MASSRYLVCYLICCMYFAGKLWKVAQLQYHQWRGFRDPDLEPGLWNAAASRDVFMETLTSISGAHRFARPAVGHWVLGLSILIARGAQ